MATDNSSTGYGGQFGQAADGLKDEAAKAADQITATAGDAADRAKDTFSGVREQAMSLKDQAFGQARSAAEEGKSRAAEAISGIAQAARDAAGQLGQNPTIAPVGKYGEQAADALERFAGTLRNKEVDALLDDVAGLVRRNPAVAAGVAVVVGFALSRLFRSDSGNQA